MAALAAALSRSAADTTVPLPFRSRSVLASLLGQSTGSGVPLTGDLAGFYRGLGPCLPECDGVGGRLGPAPLSRGDVAGFFRVVGWGGRASLRHSSLPLDDVLGPLSS